MNFINIIIISGVLVGLVVIIAIVTKSLKNVDEKIVEEIRADGSKKKLGFFSKLKVWAISLFEWIVKRTKKNIQKLHSWVIRAKKRSKSDIVKARDEFMIKNESQAEHIDKVNVSHKKDKPKKDVVDEFASSGKGGSGQVKKTDIYKEDEGEISAFYNKKEEVPIDSLATERRDGEGGKKNSFVKSLFKKHKRSKKVVDIQSNSDDKWTLDGGDKSNVLDAKNSRDENIEIAEVGRKFTGKEKAIGAGKKAGNGPAINDNDEMIGVDRKILEKKILQKIDNNPRELNNYRELGELYIKMEKLDDALEVFEYVLSVKPRDLVSLRRKRKIKLLKRISK